MNEIIIITLLCLIAVEVYVLSRPRKKRQTRQISTLVDTSVLMDGRVVNLAETGFLLGQVIVPRSVLTELQLLADGSDHDKRERARLGMDAIKKLKDMLGGSFYLLQDGEMTRGGVDERLIVLAKETDSAILTLDYNLNKVAQVEGVEVLNINELAKSIRMVHLPGDEVSIELTQKGQSSDQAVGYLPDGTMVVVERAKKFIGQTKRVEIVRSLQTDAGKMMFARLVSVQHKTQSPSSKPSGQSGKTKQLPRMVRARKSDTGSDDNKSRGKTLQRVTKRRKPTASEKEDELVRLAQGQ